MSGTDTGVEVATAAGTLRGRLEDGLAVFRGIRYAAPPTGERRLAPPAPPPTWDGVRDAVEFSPACPQGARARGGRPSVFGGLFGPGDLGTDEDCLALNVWTPGCDDGRRPVLVWIHGGAFRLGTGGSPSYHGHLLARRGGVVVVTLNYRLGALGFLHLPELEAVNLGLQDQVAALRWVRDEIAGFGGDPDDVTVFGESAGAKSVECLLAMPSARDLFRRAVLQSTYDPGMDAAAASGTARAFLQAAGVPADRPEALRELAVDDLLAAQQALGAQGGGMLGTGGGGLSPVVDGEVLPAAPVDAARAGDTADVPVVVGTNLDENRLFGRMMPGAGDMDEATARERLAGMLPGAESPGDPPVDRALEVYRASLGARGAPSAPADVVFAAMTDRLFRQHSIRLAEAHAAHRPDTWMYLFCWPSPAWDGVLGACHALEIPFVFGTLDGPLGELATGGDEARAREAASLSERMQGAWLAFATKGDPGWPRFDADQRTTMVFGDRARPEDDPLAAERHLWS